MKNKIQKMYVQDNTVIWVFTGILWILLIYVISKVDDIAPNSIARIVVIVAGITVCSFVTASSMAVLSHLKKNKIQLYEEDTMSFFNDKN